MRFGNDTCKECGYIHPIGGECPTIKPSTQDEINDAIERGIEEQKKPFFTTIGALPLKEGELAPCPFCGSHEISLPTLDQNRNWFVDCLNISCRVNPRTSQCGTKDAAIEAWNTRAISAQPSADEIRNAALEDAIDIIEFHDCSGEDVYICMASLQNKIRALKSTARKVTE